MKKMKDLIQGGFDNPTFKEKLLTGNSDIALFENIHDLATNEMVQLNVFAIMLCTKGTAKAAINNVTYDINAGDFFICLPRQIVDNAMMSVNFECRCICFSIDFVKDLEPTMPFNGWEAVKKLSGNQKITATQDDITAFHLYYELLRNKLSNADRQKNASETIRHIVLAFLYEMQSGNDTIAAVSQGKNFTAGETIFNKFVTLLAETTPKKRSPSYYADRLNITPKYLWNICRNIDGRSTTEIIDSYIAVDIKNQLRYTNKTIKEIAMELDFPNVSFFGRYVRKTIGMSPKAYRQDMSKPAFDIHQ